ncbi:MAG TPA: branched-chain amino acid ABC transporter permease [Firmicutes bacterium]|jgi:branched-chain amino acid transport system permease protein|nr:branched-chain amino acid ABC transporter permease [Bacillota bacterium]
MSLAYLIQNTIDGLSLGSIYALIAIGFSLTFSILRLINFAHGDILMIGAYCALFIVIGMQLPLWAALILAMGFAALVGIFIERLAYRPLRGSNDVAALITSLAVSIIIQNTGIMTVTAQPRKFEVPEVLSNIHNFGNISISNMTLLIISLSLVLMIAFSLFVTHTKIGVAMRACSENIGVAQLMGIDINRVISTTFALGSAMAAVSGIMLAGQYGRIEPLMGFVPGLKAFVAAVIGGIGSVSGAALGGYVLGLSEILLVALLPPAYSGYRDAFVFIILILVLLFKPSGILGQAEGRKV